MFLSIKNYYLNSFKQNYSLRKEFFFFWESFIISKSNVICAKADKVLKLYVM